MAGAPSRKRRSARCALGWRRLEVKSLEQRQLLSYIVFEHTPLVVGRSGLTMGLCRAARYLAVSCHGIGHRDAGKTPYLTISLSNQVWTYKNQRNAACSLEKIS